MANVFLVRVRSVKGFVFEGRYASCPSKDVVRADIATKNLVNKADLIEVVDLARPWPQVFRLPFLIVARNENWRRVGTVGFSVVTETLYL